MERQLTMVVIAQDLGMVTFLAVVNCIYQNLAMRKVSQVLPEMDAAEIKDLIAGTSSQTYKALSEEMKGRVTPQITDAMSYVWLFFLVAATCSFLLSPPLGVSCGLVYLPLGFWMTGCLENEVEERFLRGWPYFYGLWFFFCSQGG
jgi:hypothetical protein